MLQSDEILARRYGQSFVDVLAEQSPQDLVAIGQQWKDWEQLLKGELLAFLTNPSFELAEKQSVLDELLTRMQSPEQLGRFIKLLSAMGHLGLWVDIGRAYQGALQERRNETQAKVKTAFPLSPVEEKRLKEHLKSLTKKEVLLEISQDPSLIGGVQVEVAGALYDASVAGYLKRLQQECMV